MIYGIMGALPEEIRLLGENFTDKTARRVADVDFISGNYAGHTVVLCCAGMGKVNAAAATQILISVFGAERIVFSGIAGNCSPLLDVGDVAIGCELVHHDIDDLTLENTGLKAEVFCAAPALVAAAEAACKKLGVNAVTGRIATGEKFICEKRDRRPLRPAVRGDGRRRRGAGRHQKRRALCGGARHERQRRRRGL